MIKPTVGRVVLFNKGVSYVHIVQRDQPLKADIVYVWSDRMVNLSVIDADGAQHAVTSVRLLQDDEHTLPGNTYCEWMPFQKGQAAQPLDQIRAEALSQAVHSTSTVGSHKHIVERAEAFEAFLRGQTAAGEKSA